jgi:hypothetical protein
MTDFSDTVAKYLKVNSVGVPEMFQFQDRKGVRNMLAGDSGLSPQERKRLLKTYDTYFDKVVGRPGASKGMKKGGEVKSKPKKKASKKPRGAGVATRGTKFIGVR